MFVIQAMSHALAMKIVVLASPPAYVMPQMVAVAFLFFIMFIGDAVSTKTKAFVPSIFVAAVLLLFGYWTFFPQDIVARAGFPLVVALLLMSLLIVNMGTLLSMRELINQWKTVAISLTSIVGIIIACFTIGVLVLDWNTVVVGVPPLIGGIVSATLMAGEAAKHGLDSLAVFAVVIYVVQGFVGYPITSFVLKREGSQVLEKYRKGEWRPTGEQGYSPEMLVKKEEGDDFPLMFQRMPKAYNTSYFMFFRIALVGLLAYFASTGLAAATGIKVHALVFCLLFGVIAKSVGFLEKHPLQKAGGFGFAILGLMLFILDSLKRATPQMLMDLLTPLVVLIAIGVVGMYVLSAIAAYFLKVRWKMAFAIALTALYGFPADYVITVEVINSLTKDEEERKALSSYMIGPMLVGGFISVTIVSVILAGIMMAWINKPFF